MVSPGYVRHILSPTPTAWSVKDWLKIPTVSRDIAPNAIFSSQPGPSTKQTLLQDIVYLLSPSLEDYSLKNDTENKPWIVCNKESHGQYSSEEQDVSCIGDGQHQTGLLGALQDVIRQDNQYGSLYLGISMSSFVTTRALSKLI